MFGPPGMVPPGIPMGVTPQGDLTPYTQFSAKGDIAPFHPNQMGDVTMFPNIGPNGDPIIYPGNSQGDTVMTTAEYFNQTVNAAVASVATRSAFLAPRASPNLVRVVEPGKNRTKMLGVKRVDAEAQIQSATDFQAPAELSLEEKQKQYTANRTATLELALKVMSDRWKIDELAWVFQAVFDNKVRDAIKLEAIEQTQFKSIASIELTFPAHKLIGVMRQIIEKMEQQINEIEQPSQPTKLETLIEVDSATENAVQEETLLQKEVTPTHYPDWLIRELELTYGNSDPNERDPLAHYRKSLEKYKRPVDIRKQK